VREVGKGIFGGEEETWLCGGFACGRSNAKRVLMACLALFGPYLSTRLALPCLAVD
jgi:hypothetical protein